MIQLKTQKLNKRQEDILNYTSLHGKLSVSGALERLERDGFGKISRATIVRDFGFLVVEGFLEREGKGRAVKYSLTPRYDFIKKIDVEAYFSVPQDKRKAKRCFDFGIFDALKTGVFTPEERNLLEGLHREFQRNLKKIKSGTVIAKEFERIVIEFSWKSSQIEGNTYSLLDTEILIKERREAKGKTKKEAIMILNHKKAFDFVMENKSDFKKLSLAKIEEVHRLLTVGLGVVRNLRSAPVGITGTNYKPLDNVFQIKEAMERAIDLVNTQKNFFEKAFLVLILLSYIQPFEDGNKRTARLVSNAVLLAHESIPVSYRAVNEIEYKKASLLFYEVNNLSYFKQIFIKQFEFAVKNYF